MLFATPAVATPKRPDGAVTTPPGRPSAWGLVAPKSTQPQSIQAAAPISFRSAWILSPDCCCSKSSCPSLRPGSRLDHDGVPDICCCLQRVLRRGDHSVASRYGGNAPRGLGNELGLDLVSRMPPPKESAVRLWLDNAGWEFDAIPAASALKNDAQQAGPGRREGRRRKTVDSSPMNDIGCGRSDRSKVRVT